MFGVRGRRGGDEKRLQARVGVGFDAPLGIRFDDDHVARFDGVFLGTVANDPASGTDVDRDVARGGMNCPGSK